MHVKVDQAEAHYEKGIFKIVMPKAEEDRHQGEAPEDSDGKRFPEKARTTIGDTKTTPRGVVFVFLRSELVSADD